MEKYIQVYFACIAATTEMITAMLQYGSTGIELTTVTLTLLLCCEGQLP